MHWILVICALVAIFSCDEDMTLEDKKVENALFAMVGEDPPHDIPINHEDPALHDKLVAKAKNITLKPQDHHNMDHSKHSHHFNHAEKEHNAHHNHSEHKEMDHGDHNDYKNHSEHEMHQNHQEHDAHGAHDSHHGHSEHENHHGAHGAHMMMMWFHGGSREVILFDFWRIESCCGLVISCGIIFVMGALYEGLKWFRVFLTLSKTTGSCRKNDTLPVVQKSRSVGIEQPLVNANSRSTTPETQRPGPFSMLRTVQALLYIVQLVLAYWLMLIVMTYNTWLTIAVILGAGFGHWMFAALRFANPSGEAADSIATDACH